MSKSKPAITTPAPAAENLISLKDAAASIGTVSRATLYRWAAARKFKFYRIGPKLIRVRLSEVMKDLGLNTK